MEIKSSMASKDMKSIELFAGAGGLGIGTSRAGFDPVLIVEWDKNCRNTLHKNRRLKNSEISDWPEEILLDVRDVDFRDYVGKIDFLTGGPPCQPFSMGGKHRAYADSRDMFPEAVRAVREVQPEAFMFENVKGLTRASFSGYFEYITLQLRHPYIEAKKNEDWAAHYRRLQRHHTSHRETSEDYRVVTQVLNAANYGVPQRRERVFFVGFRADSGIEWSFPEATHSQKSLVWDQSVNGTYLDKHKINSRVLSRSNSYSLLDKKLNEKPDSLKPWLTIRDALTGMPNPIEKGNGEFLNHIYQAGAKSYPGHTGSPFDEPSKTLKAGVHGVPGGENMIRYQNGKVRYLTVRESARIQTFPDDFVLTGSWTESMRQLGNAVPVELARVLASDIRKTLVDTH
jgi:DNA (cytosine-5)-methyltransferase 1